MDARVTMWEELLCLAEGRGIVLPPGAARLFGAYYELLAEGNRQSNLTRITAPREVLLKHFLDSLALLAFDPAPAGPLLDVGSGAGMPGVPLKLARPELPVLLLDSSRKRVDFLTSATGLLGLNGLTVLHGRAEDLARQNEYRDRFPLVVSRALARLPVLLELCLPFVQLGGRFVAYKGPEAQQELSAANRALAELGAQLEESVPYSLPDGFGERLLLVFVKITATPSRYPRKPGIPEKKPLGSM